MIKGLAKALVALSFTLLATAINGISLATAGELQLDPSITSTLYHYQRGVAEQSSQTDQAISLVPAVNGSYTSQYLQTSVFYEHTSIERTSNDEDFNNSFHELNYRGRVTLYENALSMNFYGDISNRALEQRDSGIASQIFTTGDFTKFAQHSADITFVTPNPQYLGFSSRTTYSLARSGSTLDNPNRGLDNGTIQFEASFFEGERVDNSSWELDYQHLKTDRAQLDELTSTLASVFVSTKIISSIRAVVSANVEEYDFSGVIGSSFNEGIDTKSYGAGLQWYSSTDRTIALTYNQLDEGQSTTNYLGVKLDWAFSGRTALNAKYSKRFFGDAIDLNLTFNPKKLRTSFSYTEEVVSISSLGLGTESLGLFVCPFGASELTNCFQPSSLQYELQPGEGFINTSQTSADITEEFYLQKIGQMSLGYQGKRLSASVSFAYTTSEFLESENQDVTRSTNINLAYQLNRKHRLTLNSNINNGRFTQNTQSDEVISVQLSLVRQMSRRLEMELGLIYSDRQSDETNRNDADKLITLSVKYSF